MTQKPFVLAVIPARGGSKRIPDKNIHPFNGKPMIQWTLDAARNSGICSDILVSTDKAKIAKAAEEAGIPVPFLREDYNDDHSPISLATAHAVQQYEEKTGQKVDIVIQLMANCPLRTAEDIQNAYKQFIEDSAKTQISAFQLGWMNPWWAHRCDENHAATPLFPEALKSRSQDLDSLYCPTGAVWISDRDTLIKEKNFYAPNYRFFILHWVHAIDIDDYEDLKMASSLVQ